VQFKKVVGHKILKERLINAVKENRISNTQLFLGPEGSGNLAMALAFSQFINCLSPLEDDSCGLCSSCLKYESLIHPDLHFTYPTISPIKLSKELLQDWREAFLKNPYLNDFEWFNQIEEDTSKQGNITADECRDIIYRLTLKSYEAKYKTQIIWMPEYLSKDGNRLLKMLEEPPLGTLILLVANDTENVLPTILSRCQIIKVPKIIETDIESALIDHHDVEIEKARYISRIADGNFNLALSLIKLEHGDYLSHFKEWMRACWTSNIIEIQRITEVLLEQGKEYLKNFLDYSLQIMRASIIYGFGDKTSLRVGNDELNFIDIFSKHLNHSNTHKIVKSFNDSVFYVERNANVKIMFLNLSLYIGPLINPANAKK